MSHETTKAMRRRWAEHDAGGFPWSDLFKGQVLDVGSGDDPLIIDSACTTFFDLPDGGGDDLTEFFPKARGFYDVIHGSQVLEHMISPTTALASWLEMVKPGGLIIATVPDYELYEHLTFPSKWNAGHRSTWSMTLEKRPSHRPDSQGDCGNPQCPTCYATHIKLPKWLEIFDAEVVLCRLVDTNYDRAVGPDVDQTLDAAKGVEAFIELVLRKP